MPVGHGQGGEYWHCDECETTVVRDDEGAHRVEQIDGVAYKGVAPINMRGWVRFEVWTHNDSGEPDDPFVAQICELASAFALCPSCAFAVLGELNCVKLGKKKPQE